MLSVGAGYESNEPWEFIPTRGAPILPVKKKFGKIGWQKQRAKCW